MVFSSKIDGFYMGVIIVATIIGVVLSNIVFVTGYWFVSLIVLALFCFINFNFFSTSIILGYEEVIIKVGFFKKKIAYKNIKEIRKTRNVVASTATSVKRIGIRTSNYKGSQGFYYVSPKLYDEFFDQLKLKLKDNVLVTDKTVK